MWWGFVVARDGKTWVACATILRHHREVDAGFGEDERAGMFPVAACVTCGCAELVVAEYDAGDEPVRRCAVCGAGVLEEGVQWVTADALRDLGFEVLGDRRCGSGCGLGCAVRRG
jgi:hypothetical protein